MTRSLVVTTWFPDHENPSRTPFCLQHVKAIQTAGIDVAVIHVDLGRRARRPVLRETYEGVEVCRGGLSLRNPLAWFPLVVLIRRALRDADVLHTMAFSSIMVALPAWLLRRRPWIHTEHWNGVVKPGTVTGVWPRVAWLRHLLRIPDAVTGVARPLTDSMEQFARPGRVRVVPPVVEPTSVRSFPPATTLRLVGVGQLNARKDPLLAIETVAWVAAREPNLVFSWVGDGPLRAVATAKARALGLESIVSFPGAVDPKTVRTYIDDAHLFFVPSRSETFFAAMAEAIAAGRPAVVAPTFGLGDFCNEYNSVRAESFEPAALGQAILEARARLLTQSPETIAATIGDRFSSGSVGRAFANVYADVLRGPV